MRFEPRHAFLASQELDLRRPTAASAGSALPLEIAFLRDLHIVGDATLRAASQRARRERNCAARTLMAAGDIDAAHYYRALAYHLGLTFLDGRTAIAPIADPAVALRTGCVPLAPGGPARWLVAPQDGALHSLLRGRQLGLPDLAITTPQHLAAIICDQASEQVEWLASEALPTEAPLRSAKGALDAWIGVVATLVILFGILGLFSAPGLSGDILGLLFFAGVSFRLGVCAAGLSPHKERVAHLVDAALPVYTVLVPLRQEAEIVPDLLAALDALDYPRAKLDVLLLVEPEDLSTRAALHSARLPPWLQVILGPTGGSLRTKPRALNIGLLMARGTLLTVYDAEDRPAPDQLRRAAALFAAAQDDLACVQARLAVDNGAMSLLPRLFALEYAALFDVMNIGTARLRLPLALGGTSNHFRTATLRAVGGWDAWNVTEDADLGLRLAQLGYRVDCLDSTTKEAAPDQMRVWMKQRRRWTKGWMQTFLVLARDAPGVARRLGWKRSGALALLLVNLVVGPLLFPVFCGLVALHLITAGVPTPRDTIGICEATLATSVLALGIASTLWCGHAGLRARRLLAFLPSLPLLLPYQLMISAAAWMGLADLVFRPYHWHKTTHRATAYRAKAPHADQIARRKPTTARVVARTGLRMRSGTRFAR